MLTYVYTYISLLYIACGSKLPKVGPVHIL